MTSILYRPSAISSAVSRTTTLTFWLEERSLAHAPKAACESDLIRTVSRRSFHFGNQCLTPIRMARFSNRAWNAGSPILIPNLAMSSSAIGELKNSQGQPCQKRTPPKPHGARRTP